jgi:GDP-D-mannose dehydratase
MNGKVAPVTGITGQSGAHLAEFLFQKPDDCVPATSERRNVREFVGLSSSLIGKVMKWSGEGMTYVRSAPSTVLTRADQAITQ